MDDLTHAVWHKSSRSGSGEECVEVAHLADGGRAIRDSKDLTGPALRCTPAGWVALTTSTRSGQFH